MIAQKPILQCLVNLPNSGSRVVSKTVTKIDISASAALKKQDDVFTSLTLFFLHSIFLNAKLDRHYFHNANLFS